MAKPLPIGKVAGHRGRSGALTVRVASGLANRWTGLTRVLIEEPSSGGTVEYGVESARAYRDRLIVKLRDVDDGDAAERFRGRLLFSPPDQVPELPDGQYYFERLIGLAVEEPGGEALGEVVDVLETGGVDVLVVVGPGGEEILIPLADEFLVEVDEEGKRIVVRLPEGLRELNRGR